MGPKILYFVPLKYVKYYTYDHTSDHNYDHTHEHNYERFWPMYNYTVKNGTNNPSQPYTDARAPLHIITGSAVSF